MADSGTDQTGSGGSGPLYQQSDAGRRAADEPVNIPGKDDDAADNAVKPIGEEQAAANREVDPAAE